MIYNASPIAIGIFISFVLVVLWISTYFAKKTQTSKGYYAAGNGAGIYNDGSKPTIKNCILRTNYASPRSFISKFLNKKFLV